MMPSGVAHRPPGRVHWAPRRKASLLLLPLLLLPAGCRNTGQQLLESELRARERDVRELKEELSKVECHNEALQRELGAIRQQTPATVVLSPEQAAQTYTLRRITLGRGTGGYDQDHQLGDDALQVVLEPRDGDDHVIKAPGTATLTALEISPEGLKTPFSSWVVSPEELRKSWRSGFFSTGYILVLPWQGPPPHTEQVRVIARFQTTDGRAFEAERDVRVVLRPEVLRERLPPPPEPPAPIPGPPAAGPPPPEPMPLPPPRTLDPALPPGGPTLPAPAPAPVQPAANWQAAPLEGAIQLGRPAPLLPVP